MPPRCSHQQACKSCKFSQLHLRPSLRQPQVHLLSRSHDASHQQIIWLGTNHYTKPDVSVCSWAMHGTLQEFLTRPGSGLHADLLSWPSMPF